MKLVSWNEMACGPVWERGSPNFLKAEAPDVICLQETKMQQEQADFEFPGYYEYWNSSIVKKGYSVRLSFPEKSRNR